MGFVSRMRLRSGPVRILTCCRSASPQLAQPSFVAAGRDLVQYVAHKNICKSLCCDLLTFDTTCSDSHPPLAKETKQAAACQFFYRWSRKFRLWFYFNEGREKRAHECSRTNKSKFSSVLRPVCVLAECRSFVQLQNCLIAQTPWYLKAKSVQKLSELNPYMDVSIRSEREVSEASVKQHNGIVAVNFCFMRAC